MNRYIVTWSKTYHIRGEEIVEAHSRLEAEDEVEEKIGDYEGSLHWDPDANFVEAIELRC